MIMVRVFLFTVQIILLIAAGYWIFNHPGSVSIHWLGYDIEAHIGVAFVALVTIVFTLLFLYKVIGWVAALPRRLMGLRGRKRRGRGFQSLTIGLSAVAAGDSRLASYHAYRMRQFLPDEKGLPWLLEAQAAKLRGEDGEAKMFFEKLLKDKDTAFMGVRGLLTAAID
jgi:HemY protein